MYTHRSRGGACGEADGEVGLGDLGSLTEAGFHQLVVEPVNCCASTKRKNWPERTHNAAGKVLNLNLSKGKRHYDPIRPDESAIWTGTNNEAVLTREGNISEHGGSPAAPQRHQATLGHSATDANAQFAVRQVAGLHLGPDQLQWTDDRHGTHCNGWLFVSIS